jgi:hypothetical protein
LKKEPAMSDDMSTTRTGNKAPPSVEKLREMSLGVLVRALCGSCDPDLESALHAFLDGAPREEMLARLDELTRDLCPETRQGAMRAIWHLNALTPELLLRLVRDEDYAVSRVASWAFEKSPASVAALRDVLFAESESEGARLAAVEGLSLLGHAGCRALIDFANSRDATASVLAAALHRIPSSSGYRVHFVPEEADSAEVVESEEADGDCAEEFLGVRRGELKAVDEEEYQDSVVLGEEIELLFRRCLEHSDERVVAAAALYFEHLPEVRVILERLMRESTNRDVVRTIAMTHSHMFMHGGEENSSVRLAYEILIRDLGDPDERIATSSQSGLCMAYNHPGCVGKALEYIRSDAPARGRTRALLQLLQHGHEPDVEDAFFDMLWDKESLVREAAYDLLESRTRYKTAEFIAKLEPKLAAQLERSDEAMKLHEAALAGEGKSDA